MGVFDRQKTNTEPRWLGPSATTRTPLIPSISAARWLLVLVAAAGVYFFYGFVVPGADPFAAQLAALREADQSIPVLALQVQDMLWNDFNTHAGTNALSIAAMPSMHVGTAVLLALLGWRLNRAAGIALTVFAMLVMIGSVHLAWHYALDGYAGGLGAWIIWHACGRLVQRSAP